MKFKTLREAIDAYIEVFDEGPPTIGWTEEEAIKKIEQAIEKGEILDEGPDQELPEDALL